MRKITTCAVLLLLSFSLISCSDNSPKGAFLEVQEAVQEGDFEYIYDNVEGTWRDKNLNFVSIGFLVTYMDGKVPKQYFSAWKEFDENKDPKKRFLGYCNFFDGKELCNAFGPQGDVKEISITEDNAKFMVNETEIHLKKIEGRWLIVETI